MDEVSVPAQFADISDSEWETRVNLAAAFRLVDLYGWSDLLATHLSARVPETEDQFLINPFGLMFDEIRASDMLKVTLDGDVLSESEYGLNPAGFTFHSAVHMARPDAHWAIHTHTQAGTAIATQKEGLLPLTQHALHIIDHMNYHAYEGIATDLSERESIARDLADNNVLVLRNHGLLTVGRTAGEAFMWMYRTERACRMQVTFQQTGAEPEEIPENLIQSTYERNRFNNSKEGYRTIGQIEWPALLRKLDRLDPSYKT